MNQQQPLAPLVERPPDEWSFPLEADADRSVREEVAKELADFSEANFNAFIDGAPGLDPAKGRELLRFLEGTDMPWWDTLAAEFPQQAGALLLSWAGLMSRYGGLNGG